MSDAIYRFGQFELRVQARLLLKDGLPVEVGGRALDLLHVLVERRGRLVAKNELLDLVWPGLVVEENNLQVQVSALRKILGQEAIKTVQGRGYRFAFDTEQPAARPAAASPDGATLPHPLTTFIGRDSDLATYARLLEHTRLLTLTAIGGCGKTRLAIELARTVRGSFPDGVWFVDLAPVAVSERVALTVAASLGARDAPDRPTVASVCERLAGKHALLVLDNCERLLVACGELVEALLSRTEKVTVLATSREQLGIAGERVVVVSPLDLAPPGAGPAEREGSAAVRLFFDRAQLSTLDAPPTSDMLSEVEDICRRLDGLPLAIELAAARLKLLSVDEIRAKLDHRFLLLTAGGRSSSRHQTLRGVIDWSYEQLAQADQQAFRRLSVFAGGWTLAAAAAIAIGSADEFEMIEILSRLFDKSLVVVERDLSGKPRYRMLETVRAYSSERLEAAYEAHEAHERHLNYFITLAETLNSSHDVEEDVKAFASLDADLDNLMAAHDWCGEDPAKAEARFRLAAALDWFLRDRGHFRLARVVIQGALDRPRAPSKGAVRAKVLDGAGRLAYDLGDFATARACFEQALTCARESADMRLEVDSLRHLGDAAGAMGDLTGARKHLADSLELARVAGLHREVAITLNDLGETYYIERELASAASHYEEALATYRRLGYPRTGFVFLNLAIIANERYEHRHACKYLHDAMTEASAVNSRYYQCRILAHAAATAAAIGDALFAARTWGAFDAGRRATGLTPRQTELTFLAARIELARFTLGALFEQTYSAGSDLSLQASSMEVHAWLTNYLIDA